MENFDINAAPLEIERKYLIEYPDLGAVRAMPGYRCVHIEQTYLSRSDGSAAGRVRRVADGGETRYIYTCKQRLTDMTRREYEREITAGEYAGLLKQKTPGTVTIEKDRHIFTYSGLTYELDVYAFWDDKATIEAEVKSEDTPVPVPPCVTLIKDVTGDRRYNNSVLAANNGKIAEISN